ncbi:hypothetical protein [Paenibacillus sp. B2(2019)]|uniref:hypothetical protein n=1 Tax=Paenibacillus sp. B2(2019) TaxID=2607754 RepID=UPI0011F1FD45|nr:hypothetical protein [Paenibacillus sp. B2(2019)]KAA1181536.1 hypothetical protein PAENI_22450 [Paenibacillus sp. B2(2019)]
MHKVKVVLSLSLLLTTAFTSASVSASSNEQISDFSPTQVEAPLVIPSNTVTVNSFLSDAEKARLSDFGFSQEEIENFTLDQYNNFNQKVGKDTTGELIGTETTYYKITNHQVTEVTEQELNEGAAKTNALNKLKESLLITAATDNTIETNWMVMTLSTTKLSTGTYNLKNSFRWKTFPTYKLTDVVGITINPNLTYLNNTEYGNYQTSSAGVAPIVYDNYALVATKKDVPGLGFPVDLKSYSSNGRSTDGHSGYVAFQVQKNNSSALSTNAYGHYAHLYNTINYSISLSSASMSISGATQTDYMSDTSLSWNF